MTRRKTSWWKRTKRKMKRKVAKKVFRQCHTCGRVNTPKHVCHIRFTPHNAQLVRNRRKKYGKK